MPVPKKLPLSEILKEAKKLYHGGSWPGTEPFKGTGWFTKHLDDAKYYAESQGFKPKEVELTNIKNPYILKPKEEEANEVVRTLDRSKYDAMYDPSVGDWVVWDPEKIIFRGVAKAEGGQINPIKSPREMLFEMAGIPSMAGGKSTAGMEMYKLITDAIERYTKMYGRPPSPEDVAALKAHAKSLEPKPITSTPQVEARARHELATDPNLQNPDLAQDPFLTKMLTGRTTKGTYLKPKTVDITDPNVRQSIEDRQLTGRLDEIANPESITPSADYISRMATGVENEILGAGKVPLIDKLKQAFFKQNGRFPTQEELDTIIAEFNPARHQYGEKGASIVTERPPSRVGQAEWRARARMEGIPEAYLNKPPADYPQYLRDELDIKRGIQPGTAVRQERPYRSSAPGNTWDSITDELGNPIQRATGGSTKQMVAELAVGGRTPPMMRDGGKPKRGYEQSWDAVKDFFLGMRDAPREVISEYAEMLDPRVQVPAATPGVDVMTVPQGRLIPFPDQGSGAYETGKTLTSLVGDPLNVLFSGPVVQGAKRAVKAPFNFVRRNPVKSSVMTGAIPAATATPEDNLPR